MFSLTAAVFLITAKPIGRLADRVGTINIFLGGYALLAGIYLGFAIGAPNSWLSAIVIVGLLGVHYAATDGVLVAAAVGYLDSNSRTTGLATLATAIGLARIASSTVYGWLWQSSGAVSAAFAFSFAMTPLVLIALVVARRIRSRPSH